MALYDEMYERYGKNFGLTQADEIGLEGAREELRELQDDPLMTPRGDGFVDENGRFILNPVVERHIRIATSLAREQLGPLLPMPEDMDTAIRFPGVDPAWHSSVIDMKFAQREAAVKAALETRTPEVREYAQGILDRFKLNTPENGAFVETSMAMTDAAQEHRYRTRASKLCHNADGRRILHQRARALETGEAVVNYEKMMQGVEYAAGIRTGPVPEEVRTFYRDVLHADLDLDMIKKAELVHPAEQLKVEFEDLDNKMLHRAQANPHNWGKTAQELEVIADSIDLDTTFETITPYARATVDRVISPAFAAQEKATHDYIHRADHIIIDGKTVREKMYEDFMAAGGKDDGFMAFFQKNGKTAVNEYVAAGLMAGKRVEAFIPDKQGRIPDQPTQITKTGYEPSPLKPEKFNAWQRYFSKRGYFKEKVARQQEYERMMAARERVKTASLDRQWSVGGGSMTGAKEPFIGGWMREHGGKLDFSSEFSVSRSALHTFAVSRMLMEGYSLEDIHNPDALLAEKDAFGREVCQKLKDKDMKWAGETLFHGMRLLRDQIDRRTADLDFANEAQVFTPEHTLTAFACGVAFDIYQEAARPCCKAEGLAAAEAYVAANVPGQTGRAYMEQLQEGTNGIANFFDFGYKALSDKAEIAGGMGRENLAGNYLNHLVGWEAAKFYLAATKAANPGVGACSYFRGIPDLAPFYLASAMLQPTKEYTAFSERFTKEPDFRRSVGEELLSGRFQQRMKMNTDMTKGEPSFHIDPPSEKGDLEVRTPEQLAATQKSAQKQAAKTHKPPQMTGPKR